MGGVKAVWTSRTLRYLQPINIYSRLGWPCVDTIPARVLTIAIELLLFTDLPDLPVTSLNHVGANSDEWVHHGTSSQWMVGETTLLVPYGQQQAAMFHPQWKEAVFWASRLQHLVTSPADSSDGKSSETHGVWCKKDHRAKFAYHIHIRMLSIRVAIDRGAICVYICNILYTSIYGFVISW